MYFKLNWYQMVIKNQQKLKGDPRYLRFQYPRISHFHGFLKISIPRYSAVFPADSRFFSKLEIDIWYFMDWKVASDHWSHRLVIKIEYVPKVISVPMRPLVLEISSQYWLR